MSIKTASEQLDDFIEKTEELCWVNSMDFRIENGRIYVYKYYYEADGSFASIKKAIDTAPF